MLEGSEGERGTHTGITVKKYKRSIHLIVKQLLEYIDSRNKREWLPSGICQEIKLIMEV